jgi:hypothetical protein
MAQESRRLVGLAAAVCVGVGCAARAPRAARTADFPEPVLVNHTAFPGTVVLATVDDRSYFYSATLKVTLALFEDGSTRFAPEQERFSELPRALSPACSEDRACVVPGDLGPFRVLAEVYLDAREGVASTATWVEVDGRRQQVEMAAGQAVFRGPAETFLVPYPTQGSTITVGGLADAGSGAEVRYRLPGGFLPFLLVRYAAGEMVPVPARADTLVLDPVRRRLSIVYHSTFPQLPAIRQIELRALVPPELSRQDDTEEERARANAMAAYLTACPVPRAPVEACSGPRPPVEPALLAAALKSLVQEP